MLNRTFEEPLLANGQIKTLCHPKKAPVLGQQPASYSYFDMNIFRGQSVGSASERAGMGWQLHTEAFVATDRHSWCDCHEVATSHLFDAERVDPAEDVLLSGCGMVGWSRCFKPIQKHLKNDHCSFFSMDGG